VITVAEPCVLAFAVLQVADCSDTQQSLSGGVPHAAKGCCHFVGVIRLMVSWSRVEHSSAVAAIADCCGLLRRSCFRLVLDWLRVQLGNAGRPECSGPLGDEDSSAAKKKKGKKNLNGNDDLEKTHTDTINQARGGSENQAEITIPNPSQVNNAQ